MAAYDYQIGSTLGGLQNLSALGIPYPKSSYKPFSQIITLGNGQSKGVGFPEAVWHYDYITLAQREALKAFVANQSATVFITTRTNEDEDADDQDDYADFEVIMHWPDEEDKDAQRRLDLDVRFTHLVLQPP